MREDVQDRLLHGHVAQLWLLREQAVSGKATLRRAGHVWRVPGYLL